MSAVTRNDLAAAALAAAEWGGLLGGQKEARRLVDDTLALIGDTLVAGEPVKIDSFGSFHPRRKRARVGRNPKHPEEAHPIPARTVVRFIPSRTLREQVR